MVDREASVIPTGDFEDGGEKPDRRIADVDAGVKRHGRVFHVPGDSKLEQATRQEGSQLHHNLLGLPQDFPETGDDIHQGQARLGDKLVRVDENFKVQPAPERDRAEGVKLNHPTVQCHLFDVDRFVADVSLDVAVVEQPSPPRSSQEAVEFFEDGEGDQGGVIEVEVESSSDLADRFGVGSVQGHGARELP